MALDYCVGSASILGNRKKNEDSFGLFEAEDCVLMVVADGMGGHHGGDLASQTLVDTVGTLFKQQTKPIQQPHAFLRHIINQAHYAIIDRGYQCNPPLQPRTTCVLALIQHDMYWTAHVGDSRAYLLRGGQVLMRTRDHSLVEELMQIGRITAKQATRHPDRNMVTRCVGGELARAESSLAGPTALQLNDVILLCSDGLWGGVNEADLIGTLQRADLNQAAMTLANQAEINSYPRADNTTLIALRWQGWHQTIQAPPAINEPADGGDLVKAISTLEKVFAKYRDELK